MESVKRPGPIAIVILIACAVVFAWAWYGEYNVEQGRKAYKHYGCAQCHESGSAPDLSKLKGKLDRATMTRFIEDPESVYREKGRRPLNPDFMPMPPLHVSHSEARQLTDFLYSVSQ